MPKVIVPVGLELGPDHPAEGEPSAFSGKLGYEVDFSPGTVTLDFEAHTVWQRAFATVDQHAQHEITRHRLIDQLRDDPDVPSDAVVPGIEMLVTDGMLVEFDPDHGPLQEMFERHRLHPCGVALGNTADRPDVFTVVNGEQGVSLSFLAFQIWASAYRSTLWQACLDLVEEVTTAYQPPEQPPDGFTVETVAGEIAAALPPLIAARCAFLDPAEESDSEYYGAVEQEYRG